jgi:hypothetical protein
MARGGAPIGGIQDVLGHEPDKIAWQDADEATEACRGKADHGVRLLASLPAQVDHRAA